MTIGARLSLFRVIACVAAAAFGACRSEPSVREAPHVARETEAPHLESRTTTDRQTGRLVREWSVLVSAGKPPQKQGVEKMYYSNGALEWSREFDHGQPKGAWRSWYQDGQPRSECFFGDASVDTIMSWWYPGGHIQSRGPARNGAHRGFWRYYYKNGQLAEEGEYFDNQKHGEWRAWNEDGKTLTLREYSKGVRVREKPGVATASAPMAPSVPASALAPTAKTTAASAPASSASASAPVATPTTRVDAHTPPAPVPAPKPADDSEDERPPKSSA